MDAPVVLAYLIVLDDILQYDLILVDVPYNPIHSYKSICRETPFIHI